MSHFTVLVIGDDIEEQMAPYDENLEVTPYRDYERGDGDLTDYWFLEDPAAVFTPRKQDPWTSDADWAEQVAHDERRFKICQAIQIADRTNPTVEELHTIVAAYKECYGEEAEVPLVDEEKRQLYSMSTYSQDSKWDYYRIGGRWAGRFILKNGAEGFMEELSYEWRDSSGPIGVGGKVRDDAPPTDGTRADQARKGDIEIKGMRFKARVEAEEEWRRFEKVIAEHGPLPDALPDGADEHLTVEQFTTLRTAYYAHPTVQALREAELIGFLDYPGAVFGVSREEFVERAALRALPCYALVLKGEWIAPGRMGWFGMSSETPDAELEYLRGVNEIIDGLPDETLLTVLDAHI